MKLGKIIRGYGSVLSYFLTLLAIATICVCVAFLTVYPLWLLATKNSSLYTVLCLSFFSCFALFFILRYLIRSYKKNPRLLFISLAKRITVLGGLGLSIFLVFNYQKIMAMIVLIAVVIIYGFLAFGLNQEKI